MNYGNKIKKTWSYSFLQFRCVKQQLFRESELRYVYSKGDVILTKTNTCIHLSVSGKIAERLLNDASLHALKGIIFVKIRLQPLPFFHHLRNAVYELHSCELNISYSLATTYLERFLSNQICYFYERILFPQFFKKIIFMRI